MAFSSKAVANKLVAILETVSGVNLARKGIPESQAVLLEADVTKGSDELGRKTAGVVYRDARFLVTFFYRLDGDEASAEDALMDAVDDFLAKLYADLTLGGLSAETSVDTSQADSPEYQPRAGREFREYPVAVIVRQYGSYNVNP